jgi:hypothetical protein
MLAFVGTTVSKPEIIAQLQAHAAADELVKGQYWQDGKGCAVGCTIHGDNHAEYEPRFGIPEMLARLEDCIFEGLPNGSAKEWPLRFMGAVQPGGDLSSVGWKFLHWLLTDKSITPGIEHPLVRDAVRQCADVLALLAKGERINGSEASAAASAAWVARSEARIEARAAEIAAEIAARIAASAASAARSEASEAWEAWSAARAARNAVREARSAARNATREAWTAAMSVASGASPASAAWTRMADKLIQLIESAPVREQFNA